MPWLFLASIGAAARSVTANDSPLWVFTEYIMPQKYILYDIFHLITYLISFREAKTLVGNINVEEARWGSSQATAFTSYTLGCPLFVTQVYATLVTEAGDDHWSLRLTGESVLPTFLWCLTFERGSIPLLLERLIASLHLRVVSSSKGMTFVVACAGRQMEELQPKGLKGTAQFFVTVTIAKRSGTYCENVLCAAS